LIIVKADEVNAVRFHAFEDFEIVTGDKFIDWHGYFSHDWLPAYKIAGVE
jgi:hypothetical protein